MSESQSQSQSKSTRYPADIDGRCSNCRGELRKVNGMTLIHRTGDCSSPDGLDYIEHLREDQVVIRDRIQKEARRVASDFTRLQKKYNKLQSRYSVLAARYAKRGVQRERLFDSLREAHALIARAILDLDIWDDDEDKYEIE